MLPLVDDYLQLFIAEKLRWLKENPMVIDHIFHTGKRETIAKLKDFIVNRKVKVIIGYPKEQTSLPAYVITLAPEQEQPIGLGDDAEYYSGYDLGIGDTDDDLLQKAEEKLSEFIAGTYMNSNYRIECWSDNGDLTSYMYIILKWCLWGSRQQMLDMGWVNIKISGTDLEPVPDYFPMFIYRRALQINLMYENLYYENISALDQYVDILEHPDKYRGDEDGNVVDEDGNVVIPAKYTWILKAHYYQVETGEDYYVKEYKNTFLKGEEYPNNSSNDGNLGTRIVDELPEFGKPNIMYFVRRKDEFDNSDYYAEYMWVDGRFEPVGTTAKKIDLSQYATLEVVDEKDETVLDTSKEYTDNKKYTTDDIGLYELGATETIDVFNQIFKNSL